MRREQEPTDDVLRILRHHHQEFSAALSKLAKTHQRSSRRYLIEEIDRALRGHLSYEEQVLYPLLSSLDADLGLESELEHHEIYDVLAHLTKACPDGRQLESLATLLAGLVEAHSSDEERTVFPMLRRHGSLESVPPPSPLW